jgi:hypothetical protein
MDFKEEIYVGQLDAETYSYCWSKFNLANDEDHQLIDCDWEQECTDEELYDALEKHGFDPDVVFNHFIDYPISHMWLYKEY